MRNFTLTLIDPGTAEPKRIDFRSYDPVRALELMEEEAIGQTAILWEGEKRLVTLMRTSSGGWQLSA